MLKDTDPAGFDYFPGTSLISGSSRPPIPSPAGRLEKGAGRKRDAGEPPPLASILKKFPAQYSIRLSKNSKGLLVFFFSGSQSFFFGLEMRPQSTPPQEMGRWRVKYSLILFTLVLFLFRLSLSNTTARGELGSWTVSKEYCFR